MLLLRATRRAKKCDIAVKNPRRCSKQTAHENHPGDNTEQYYRRSLTIPFLDHLKDDIDSRFTSYSITAMRCLGIIPSCFTSADRASDDEMLHFFEDDVFFPSAARAELDLWRYHFIGKELPDTPKVALYEESRLTCAQQWVKKDLLA